MLDGEGQDGPDTGDTQASEAKTTLTGDEAVLAELQSKLEADEADSGAQEGEAEGGQSEDDELEDFEDGDKKAKLPKWVKARVMQQADYTKKTMEVAEHRKAVEAEKARIESEAKFHRENVREVAKLVNLDDQLAAYEKLDWDKLFRENKEQHQYHMNKFQMLERQRSSLAGELQQKHQQRASEAQQETAKRYETSLARIAKEIPGWSDDLAGKLNDYAVKQGYTLEELQEHVLHPQRVSTIHKAYLFDQLMARTRAKAPASAEAAAVPVPKISSRRSPNTSSEPLDSDPPDVWLRKRNKQLGIAQGR